VDLFYRYIHFFGILLSVGTLMTEALTVKRKMSGLELRKMGLLDGAYGFAGLILITGGLLLWFKGGKPSFFYTQNPIFLTKVGLVAVIALLSIYPTVWFMSKRKVPDAEVVPVPDAVRMVVRLELALVFTVPLFAVLMARGIGYR
jgi:putative membrane protein